MKSQSVVRTIAGILALAAIPAAAIGGQVSADSALATPPAAVESEAVVGTGPWAAKIACAGCAAVAIAAGGSSIVGLIALVGAHAAVRGSAGLLHRWFLVGGRVRLDGPQTIQEET